MIDNQSHRACRDCRSREFVTIVMEARHTKEQRALNYATRVEGNIGDRFRRQRRRPNCSLLD
jgi:hypothetical protein